MTNEVTPPVICRWLRALALLVALGAGAVQAADPTGEVVRQRGDAERLRDGEVMPLAVGGLLDVGDVILTGARARLRIRFADGSAITLGSGARLVVEALEVGADGRSGRQWLNVAAGAFRFVTGAIGRAEPNAVELRTQVSTIGIRGTDLFGGALAAGMPPGELHYGVQLFAGEVEVMTPYGSVTLDAPGQGTFMPLSGDRAPTTPRIWGEVASREAAAAVAF